MSHQDCRSCSMIPSLIFETVGSGSTNRRMSKWLARPCMCARTKQTMRFCTRHRDKTPIACSLEPCANVRTTVLSQLNRVIGRKNKPNNSCDHIVEKAFLLGPRFLPDQHCEQLLPSHAPKLLTVQRLRKTRKEISLHCFATCNNLHRREKTKRPAVPAQHTNRRTKTVHRKSSATGSRDDTKMEKDPSIHVRCRFADATKLSHTVAWRAFELILYLIGHLTTLCFTERGSSAQRQLMSYLTSTAYANDW